ATVRGSVDVEVIGQNTQYAADVGHGGEILPGEVLPGAGERSAGADRHDGGPRETRVNEFARGQPVGISQSPGRRASVDDRDDVGRRGTDVDEKGIGGGATCAKPPSGEGCGGEKVGRTHVRIV